MRIFFFLSFFIQNSVFLLYNCLYVRLSFFYTFYTSFIRSSRTSPMMNVLYLKYLGKTTLSYVLYVLTQFTTLLYFSRFKRFFSHPIIHYNFNFVNKHFYEIACLRGSSIIFRLPTVNAERLYFLYSVRWCSVFAAVLLPLIPRAKTRSLHAKTRKSPPTSMSHWHHAPYERLLQADGRQFPVGG